MKRIEPNSIKAFFLDMILCLDIITDCVHEVQKIEGLRGVGERSVFFSDGRCDPL